MKEQAMGTATCHYCGTSEREMRPYGPGGSWLCHPCMKADPERERIVAANYAALLDGNAAISPTGAVVIGEQSGPRPFDLAEIDDECYSCGEGDPRNECPAAKRPCGHHCNHIWTHDACHWCGFEEQPS